jgi:hypothetical protein
MDTYRGKLMSHRSVNIAYPTLWSLNKQSTTGFMLVVLHSYLIIVFQQ